MLKKRLPHQGGTDAGAGQHTMRKLRFKDIMEIVIKCVPIRLCHGLVLNGCLNLGSGRKGSEINPVEL